MSEMIMMKKVNSECLRWRTLYFNIFNIFTHFYILRRVIYDCYCVLSTVSLCMLLFLLLFSPFTVFFIYFTLISSFTQFTKITIIIVIDFLWVSFYYNCTSTDNNLVSVHDCYSIQLRTHTRRSYFSHFHS